MVVGVSWLSSILDPALTVTHTTNGLVIAMNIGVALLALAQC